MSDYPIQGNSQLVRIDVWGGEGSMDHVARVHCQFDAAASISRAELAKGFLVNLRALTTGEGPDGDFDSRKTETVQ